MADPQRPEATASPSRPVSAAGDGAPMPGIDPSASSFSRVRRIYGKALLIGLAAGMVPLATMAIAQAFGDQSEATANGAANGAGAPSSANLDAFTAVYQRIRADYVEPVDEKRLMEGAINGMLASLDPHSSYLDARDFRQIRTQTDGEYGGLGLSVILEDGVVKVATPTPNTPAARAGLKSGDFITHLDGKLVYGGTLEEAVEQMRGKPGTTVRLTIVRPGRDKPFDVSVTREVIALKPVIWEVKGQVGYLQITSFTRNTAVDLSAAMAAIEKSLGHAPLGYVLDLRSNPGGLLDEAVDVSDVFLQKGEIVSQRGRNPQDNEHYYARPGDRANGLPVVVMIDSGSASAAEIVAGALQDHHRAVVIGQRSFGKGSVQTILPMDDVTALRLTTARYYTPSGRSVQEGGIEPDIDVPQLSDPDYKSRMNVREGDLRRHLVNEAKVDNEVLEDDGKPDPRFAATADALKARGVKDYQLDYALAMITRLTAAPPVAVAARR